VWKAAILNTKYAVTVKDGVRNAVTFKTTRVGEDAGDGRVISVSESTCFLDGGLEMEGSLSIPSVIITSLRLMVLRQETKGQVEADDS
jgi:hypothetical protein